MKSKLIDTLNKFNLKMDSIISNGINIKSNDDGTIIISSLDFISSYLSEEREYEVDEYICNLIEEYYINKRNDIINDILK